MSNPDSELVSSEYNKISDHYEDWFSRPWPQPLIQEGKAIHEILQSYGFETPSKVIDLTCGIGTQSIGLAIKSHSVTAMDISSGQIERGKREQAQLCPEKQIEWICADATQVGDFVQGQTFDAVISFANSLPLLGSLEAIKQTMTGAFSLLKPGGIVLISMRDHSNLRKHKPYLVESGQVNQGKKQGVWLETADWLEDGRRYRSHIIFIYTHPKYREFHYPFPPLDAITGEEFISLLQQCGFSETKIYDGPESTNFPCPVFIARKQ